MSGAGGAGMERPARTVPDRLLGFLGAGMILLALVVLLRGGAEDDSGGRPLAPPPAVSLVEPAPGATLDVPLAMVFEVEGDLQRGPSGWGLGAYHLHLQLDGLELMPGATDIEPLGGDRYRWSVGPLEPGPHRLRLFWSDASHAPVAGGGSEAIDIRAQ